MMPGQITGVVPVSWKEQEEMDMPKKTWNKDWKKPEGSGVILDENGQMAESVQREQISEDLVDLVTGGLGVARNQAKQKKKKRDDILLPEI